MRLRKLALSIGVSAALVSNLGFALGLGEIKLNSALNQPLDAQIKLLQVRDLSEEEIVVRLATQEAYDRANVERLFFLSGLKFEVVLDDPNNPHIRVTTGESVREPYLNFLLETQWPTGRMLREYTVLMDLPTFSEKNQKAVAAPSQTAPAAQTVRPRPTVKAAQPAPEARPAPRAQAAPSQASGGDYAVRSNDTLWNIALMARPDRSYSVQQTMLAIQRLNPDAFIDNNINLLKKGQVLRLPNADEISALSTRQAINEVAYQNSQWSGGAALEAGRRSGAVADRETGREGRVQLSSGSSSTDVRAGGGRGRNTEVLENELAIAQEQLGAAQRQNEDLRTRVTDLEDQIQTMERLLEVTSEELRALQLAANQTADGTTADAAAPTTEPAVEPSAAPAAPAAEKPAAPASTVVRNTKPEPTLIDRLMDNILYIALALVALLGGLFFWKRRQEQDVEQEDELDFFEEPEAESEAENPFALPNDVQDELDEVPEESADEAFDEVESAEAETADVAAEADIYIAYGKYDQAEEMLLKALEREPGREDVTLKLLEVYAETKNLEAFDQHYAGLLASGEPLSQQRAEELRDSIPGAGEFDRTQVQPVAVAASSAALDVDDADTDVDPLLSLAEEGVEDGDFDALEGLEDLDAGFDELEAGDEGELSLDLDDDANLDDLDFSLDGLEEAAAEEPDDAMSLELDTTADAEDSDDESFSLDLGDSDDEDFALDLNLDDAAESAEEPLSLDALDLDNDEFSLDLDADSEPATQPEMPAEEPLSLSLDDEVEALDAPLAAEADDDVFDLSELEDASAPAPAERSDEDDFAITLDADEDLDFELEDETVVAPPAATEAAFDLALDDELTLDMEPDSIEALGDEEPESLTVEADDFDSSDEFSDADMAALDQEMESLSADLELDDDLVALDDSPAPLDEPQAPEEEPEFDISADLGIEDGAEELPPLASAEEDVFEQAMADTPETDDEDAVDAELGFLADSDEVATKLDLARAYIDMGDSEGARDILSEVLEEGDTTQKGEAQELMSRID